MQMIRKSGNGDIIQSSKFEQISPQQAYNLLMRFLSNPCPSIAMRIIEHRENISRIARQYKRMLDAKIIGESYYQGISLFLRAFDQAESIINQYGFNDLEYLNDEERKLLKIMRVNSC